MVDPGYTLSLLENADAELRALEHLLDRDIFEDFIFGYHAQQIAEKCLKVILTSRNIDFPFTHSLIRLFDDTAEVVPKVNQFEDLCFLSKFAIQVRYEGINFDAPLLDRVGILSRIRALVAFTHTAVDEVK